MPPTVILLPGLHGTSELFTSFIAAAPQGIRITEVDYPSNEASVEVLERVARERLVDPCIIIAESFSGLIGARIAVDDRVKALILCNSFVRSPFLPILGYLTITPVFSIPLPSFLIRTFLSGRHSDPTLVASVQSVLGRLPASTVARRVREVSQADERETVKALRNRFCICGVPTILSYRNGVGRTFSVFVPTRKSSEYKVHTCCSRSRPPSAGGRFCSSSRSRLRNSSGALWTCGRECTLDNPDPT
jgi:pimeloyl-ACP methyl ester carboxylesterase